MIGDWIDEHRTMLLWTGGISLVAFFGSIFVVWYLIVKMPADYFVRKLSGDESSYFKHPVLRLTLRIIKNIAGVIFLLAGIIMLVTPGQGVLSILIGISMIDFPGKVKFQLSIVRRPNVRHALDTIRARHGQPPLQIPEEDEEPRESNSGQHDSADIVAQSTPPASTPSVSPPGT